MPQDRLRTPELQPGETVMIRGRSWVVDGLRPGRNGKLEIQTTRRAERLTETVLWPADVFQGYTPRRSR